MVERTTKAVFLSYASQDAEPARRLCEALRAAGIEVWFDQSELRGGDAWDQKIRRQIRECVLFVPLISANTDARPEGYFRLEWKLAVDRSHLMADDKPFLLPVVVDDTPEPAARVPERFREVQWTRVNSSTATPAFAAHVQSVLTAVRRPVPATASVTPPPAPVHAVIVSTARRRRHWRWLLVLPVAGGVAAALFLATRPALTTTGATKEPAPAGLASTEPPAPALSPGWPRDADLQRALALIQGNESVTEDFALAEDLVRARLARNSTDADAVTVMAMVQNVFLYRGTDRSDDRAALARRYAERAVQLAPEHPHALAALGIYLFARGPDYARARELLEKAIQAAPHEPFFHRFRDNAMFADRTVPTADAIASAERTAARFPGDALVHYELARRYRDLSRIEDMERALDRSIAVQIIPNALVWKARIALLVREDPAAMKGLLDRVPPRTRSAERVVLSRWVYAMVTQQPADGLAALQSLTSTWIEDYDYVGPKALLLAQLHELGGRRELARLQYEAALAELRQRQARNPGDALLPPLEAWIMQGLGRPEEARRINQVALESQVRPLRMRVMSDWWFTTIPRCLLIGERALALELLREAVNTTGAPEPRTAVRVRMQLDPRMAPWRDDPEIVTMLRIPDSP